jgi:RNA polymerase sigma-70 factor (family 1)
MSVYSKFSDAELSDLLRGGDRKAFAEIYTRYKWLLHAHAHKWMHDREEAKDIIHDLFSNLWDKHESLNFNSTLSGYLYAAVRNKIMNRIAHKKVESTYISSLQTFLDKGESLTDHLVRENELRSIIEKEIAALPVKMREVFELSRKANLSHKDIAEQLDISEQTVRKHVQNALRTLRVRLGVFVFLYMLFSK